MAWIVESSESRGGEEGIETQSRSLNFIVQLAAGETETTGLALVQATIPTTFDGYYFQTIRYTPKEAGIVEYEAKYSNKEPKQPEKQADDEQEQRGEFTFDTTGGREKIWYSKETVARYGVGGAEAADYKGGINVSKTGIEGIDITVPTFKFSLDIKMPVGLVSGDYIGVLFSLTGKVNDKYITLRYRGVELSFKRRELLFKGARGSQKGTDAWSFVYEFEASAQAQNLSIGNATVGVNIPGRLSDQFFIPLKPGWDYLWVAFTEKQDADTKTLVQVPTSAHIERVYDEADFDLLELN